MPRIVVEYEFAPPASDEQLAQMASALSPCAAVRQMRRVRSVISADRTRGFCEFEAPDAETAREAYRSARVPFRAVWVASVYEAPPADRSRSGA